MKSQTKKIVAGLVGTAALLMSAAAFAQQGTPAYWRNAQDPKVWKNNYGQCWRAGYWTPALAAEDKDGCACDKDLLPKEKCEPPAPPPAPKAEPAPTPPPPPPPPAKLAPEKVNFSADVLFEFDKAVLKPEGKQALDGFAGKLKGVNYEVIVAVGHTDRIGSEEYNKKLSVRRAEAVKEYLVKDKGIPANKVYTDGKGESDPVTKAGQCKGDKKSKALIDCLQPDRRVDVEVAGTRDTK